MDLDGVSRDDWVLAAVATLLAFDLLFLPWLDYTVPLAATGSSISVTSTATGAPDGWLGVLAVIAVFAVVGHLAVDRLSDSRPPALAGSPELMRFLLACAAAVCVALKFLLHVQFSSFGFGFWAGLALTVALIVAASANSG
jgi:hypothetical protein